MNLWSSCGTYVVSSFQLTIFSWRKGGSWHRIGSVSCISLVPNGTLLPCLSKRWGKGTGDIALIQAEIWEVLAQKIRPIRGYQWSASHSPITNEFWELPPPTPVLTCSHVRPCLLTWQSGISLWIQLLPFFLHPQAQEIWSLLLPVQDGGTVYSCFEH